MYLLIKLKINVNYIPEHEVFVSFQCNVLSVPITEGYIISFKSQAAEFNRRICTEIPFMLCVFILEINNLQKGNLMLL